MVEQSHPTAHRPLGWQPQELLAFCSTTLCRASHSNRHHQGNTGSPETPNMNLSYKNKAHSFLMSKAFYTDKVYSSQLLCILVRESWFFPPIYLQSTISGAFLQNICIQALALLIHSPVGWIILFIMYLMEINTAITILPLSALCLQKKCGAISSLPPSPLRTHSPLLFHVCLSILDETLKDEFYWNRDVSQTPPKHPWYPNVENNVLPRWDKTHLCDVHI